MSKKTDDVFGAFYNLKFIDEEEEYEKKHKKKHKKHNKKKDKKGKKKDKSKATKVQPRRPLVNLPPVNITLNFDLGDEANSAASAIATIASRIKSIVSKKEDQ